MYGTPEGTCAIFYLSRGDDLISHWKELISRGHDLKQMLYMSLPGFRSFVCACIRLIYFTTTQINARFYNDSFTVTVEVAHYFRSYRNEVHARCHDGNNKKMTYRYSDIDIIKHFMSQ